MSAIFSRAPKPNGFRSGRDFDGRSAHLLLRFVEQAQLELLFPGVFEVFRRREGRARQQAVQRPEERRVARGESEVVEGGEEARVARPADRLSGLLRRCVLLYRGPDIERRPGSSGRRIRRVVPGGQPRRDLPLQMPGRADGDAQDLRELLRAQALAARRQQIEALQPDMHRDVAVLEDRAVSHRERLAADIAFPGADR
jgi:hypothetical protein